VVGVKRQTSCMAVDCEFDQYSTPIHHYAFVHGTGNTRPGSKLCRQNAFTTVQFDGSKVFFSVPLRTISPVNDNSGCKASRCFAVLRKFIVVLI